MADGVVWDLASFFPAFGGPEMAAFKERMKADVEDLSRRAADLGPLGAGNAAGWEHVLLDAEEFMTRASHIGSYVGCLRAGEAANEDYAQEQAALTKFFAEYGKFQADVLAAVKETSDADFDAFVARPKLATAAFTLRRMRETAKYTMPAEQEKLATDLAVDGFHSWGRLYSTVTGKLEFEWTHPDGTKRKTPFSQWRSLTSDVDRKVGRAAFEGGNRAMAAMEDMAAACLNAIAGTRLTLNRRRGWGHFLAPSLFQAAMERETLDAMYSAIRDNIEVARDIFRAKGHALGRKGIHMFEREAPLPLPDSARVKWQEGAAMVEKSFRSVYPGLAAYYRSMLERCWIESEVRPGKQPGAFCTGSPLTREQRVYMTFNGTLGDVRTLAHEVGHAWHTHVMKDLRPFNRGYPATLAETASTFGEHIYADGVYGDPAITEEAKLPMLDAELNGAAILLLDIMVRFEFEKRFHEEREKGEVSVSRLKELMVSTQREVLGDSLLPGGEDPYFWASKLHFYMTGITFYNYPYTVGFLLARSLWLRLSEEGPSFLPKYEEFLRLTGSDTVERSVRRAIGADTRDPAFWARAVRSLAEPLALYRKLLAAAGLPRA
ncbi:MAG: M3 family oligoendopeptidase [Planctomycetes bacterium]|jgi:oligoendopeptidase F|nr:M3 family oligoendopeptidase [Planctomycetota bacterium]